MLVNREDANKYLLTIEAYLGRNEDEVLPYIQTMAEHIATILMDTSSLSLLGSNSNFFSTKIDAIKQLMQVPTEADSIGKMHFELAMTLRYVSISGSPDYSSHPIIRFYIHPNFSEVPLDRVDKILFEIPFEVYNERIGLPSKKLEGIAEKVEEWSSSIENWETRITAAEGRYKSVLSANNFLGLSHAFEKIIATKSEEVKGLLWSMRVLGGLAVLVPAIQVMFSVTPALVEKLSIPLLSTAIFSIAIEVILIYYFRLIHSRWVSLKGQTSQLELRQAMCAFVHDYAEKSKDLNRDTLAKFENMIFSEVSQDNSPPPNIYDAADSIAKLLTAWKKPG